MTKREPGNDERLPPTAAARILRYLARIAEIWRDEQRKLDAIEVGPDSPG